MISRYLFCLSVYENHQCVSCCFRTEVLLLDDVERISGPGYEERFFAGKSKGFMVLKNSRAGWVCLPRWNAMHNLRGQTKGMQALPNHLWRGFDVGRERRSLSLQGRISTVGSSKTRSVRRCLPTVIGRKIGKKSRKAIDPNPAKMYVWTICRAVFVHAERYPTALAHWKAVRSLP